MRHSPEKLLDPPVFATDPLSDTLASLTTRRASSARLRTGGDWSIWYPPIGDIKFATISEGSCFLALDGERPFELKTGDCFLLTDGSSHRLGSNLDLPPIDARIAYADAVDGFARHGDRTGFFAVAGKFAFGPGSAICLFEALPSVIYIDGATRSAAMISWMLQQLVTEISRVDTGSALMADHLAHMMLVQALRVYLATTERHESGLLGGLSDAKLSAALNLMHAQPARRWSVDELAAAVGMSRSLFAQRFRARVGVSPMDYLIHWRMHLAARDLLCGHRTVSAIALSLGYGSESAFSNAFKRVMGSAPKHYQDAFQRPDGEPAVSADVKPPLQAAATTPDIPGSYAQSPA